MSAVNPMACAGGPSISAASFCVAMPHLVKGTAILAFKSSMASNMSSTAPVTTGTIANINSAPKIKYLNLLIIISPLKVYLHINLRFVLINLTSVVRTNITGSIFVSDITNLFIKFIFFFDVRTQIFIFCIN